MADLITLAEFKLYRGVDTNYKDSAVSLSISRASSYLQSKENGAGQLFKIDSVTTRTFDAYQDVGNRESDDRSLPPYRPDSANGNGYYDGSSGYSDNYGRRTQRRDRKADTYRTLFLDGMIADIVELRVDGVVVASSDYYTRPRNNSPVYAITLKRDSDTDWGSDELGIEVDGYWGYSKEPSEQVKSMTYELASALYDASKGATQNASASLQSPVVTPQGFVITPNMIPLRVAQFIQAYQLEAR